MAHLFKSIQIKNKSNSIENIDLETTSTSGSNLSLSSSIRSSSQSSDDDEEQLSPPYAELLKAITNGNLGMVKQMLDYGLDVNYVYDREQNYSFLHLACLMGHSKVIKYLLDCGANTSSVTSDGHQPIDFVEPDDSNTISYMLMKTKLKS